MNEMQKHFLAKVKEEVAKLDGRKSKFYII